MRERSSPEAQLRKFTHFGRWWGPKNGTYIYKYSLSGRNTLRWWGRSNPTGCNKICLNFLPSQVVVGTEKYSAHTLTSTHAILIPESPDENFTIFL